MAYDKEWKKNYEVSVYSSFFVCISMMVPVKLLKNADFSSYL